jgi:hypothetical protein
VICVSGVVTTVEKKSGTEVCAEGRERSHGIFGRLEAEKVGSLPPNLTFFLRLFLRFACFYLFSVQYFAAVAAEDVGSRKRKSELFTFFRRFHRLCPPTHSSATNKCQILRAWFGHSERTAAG